MTPNSGNLSQGRHGPPGTARPGPHELFEATTLIQCQNIGPLPLVLMGASFWQGMCEWGQFLVRQRVFTRDEVGFGYVTDSPAEAMDLILRSLPKPVKTRLNPLGGAHA